MKAERTLRAEPAAAAQARGFLQQMLSGAGVEPARQSDAVLVTSELVSNAISHGSHPGDRITVKLELNGAKLTILVRDVARARTPPIVLSPDEQRPYGRGLKIVERLATWSEHMTDGRREVRAQLDI